MPLYSHCPKCTAASGDSDVCPACGLIYAKYLKARVAVPAAAVQDSEPSALATLLFPPPAQLQPFFLYCRAALLSVLVVYGGYLALMDIPSWEMSSSLIHYPMVPIHEFGHVLFMPFGEFMTLLGGSLFQVALPVVFGGVFLLRNRDPFAAAVMLWWSAIAVMDVAPYIYDAWQPQHVLLTGRTGDDGAHDFVDVLDDLGLLRRARPIGYGVHAFGALMMLLALTWGSATLWRQRNKNG